MITALSRGFFDDPVFRWIMPDSEQRRESLPAFFSLFAGTFWPHGGVYTGAAGAGAALWLPPGRQLVVELLDGNHPHDAHWYLNLAGVDPDWQGRGIGSALLGAVLNQADRDGMPAYLEATSPDNRRLYERHGFRTTGELAVSDSPPLYAMWREPQAAGAE